MLKIESDHQMLSSGEPPDEFPEGLGAVVWMSRFPQSISTMPGRLQIVFWTVTMSKTKPPKSRPKSWSTLSRVACQGRLRSLCLVVHPPQLCSPSPILSIDNGEALAMVLRRFNPIQKGNRTSPLLQVSSSGRQRNLCGTRPPARTRAGVAFQAW